MLDGTTVAILLVAAVLGVLTIVLIWVFATTGNRNIDTGDLEIDDSGDISGEGEGEEEGGTELNVPTRGDPEEFEMMGVLYASDGDQVDSQKNNVLPLWGRQTYKRSHKWNYYVVLDNGINLPLIIDGDDCEAAVGCDELADRDRLRIAELGGTVYKFNKNNEPLIRYVPDV